MANNWNEIINNLKEVKDEKLESNSKILIIDAMNTYFRCFAAINHTNIDGTHIGGLTGFLKSVGFTIRTVKPTKVIIVFDGDGGSTNKRYLYPEYKANRNTTQILNWNFDTKEEEVEALSGQLTRLVQYLKLLPIQMLSIPKVEADDVIGYLAKQFTNSQVTIMSADRDFLQLVSENVTVYSPTKKIFYNPEHVFREYGVFPQNFIHYKILLGDKGDNIPKVKGIGKGKVFNLFPEIKGKSKLELEDIFKLCALNESKSKYYTDVINYRKQLEINFKLMDIVNPNIPESELEQINSTVTQSNINLDKTEFIKMYTEDKLGDSIPKVSVWVEDIFRYLTCFK